MRKLLLIMTNIGLLQIAMIAVADQIVIFGKDREILLHLQAIQTNTVISDNDKILVASELQSAYDEIRVNAIKVILIHRLDDLWQANKSRLNTFVGTSKKMVPIVDNIFSIPDNHKKSILDLLPNDVLSRFALKSEQVILRPKNGDIPMEDVILDIAIKDVARFNESTYKNSVMHRLLDYQLNQEQEAQLAQ